MEVGNFGRPHSQPALRITVSQGREPAGACQIWVLGVRSWVLGLGQGRSLALSGGHPERRRT